MIVDGRNDDRAARVTVLVRKRCPTCDRMAEVVGRVCAATGDPWVVVDIDDADPELRGEYSDVVPVMLVDGVEHASWSVDPEALRRALEAGRA